MSLTRSWLVAVLALGLATTTCGEGSRVAPAPGQVKTDIGVTHDTIKVGLLADLTGRFAVLASPVVDAQIAFWEKVNAEGGVAGGRRVELDIRDTSYDVSRHLQHYLELVAEVAAIGQSTGSPHTAQIADNLREDGMFAIPLSWYSGWAFDDNTLEQGSNYCFEGMNVVSFMNEMSPPGWTLAIVSYLGEYGQDSAVGAKIAAEHLGIEVVYDGEGHVVPGGDQTGVIAQLVDAQPSWVFITVSPVEFAEIFSGALVAGLGAKWSGSFPSYVPSLLEGPLGPAIDSSYYWPSFWTAWGTDVPGMPDLMNTIAAAYPDHPSALADYYVRGWVEAQMMEQILNRAFELGDMTQQGILDAARSIEGFDFQGLAPSQGYVGSPDEYAVRSIAIYDISLDGFTSGGTLREGGSTGAVLEREFFVSEIAASHRFSEPCYAG